MNSPRVKLFRCILLAASSLGLQSAPALPLVTNLHQFHDLAIRHQWASAEARLHGTVCWASPERNQIILQDPTGTAIMEVDPCGPKLKPGDIVNVNGACTGTGGGQGLLIGKHLIISNERFRPGLTSTNSVHLTSGRHPIRLNWFNRDSSNTLSLHFTATGIPPQTIPDTSFLRTSQEPEGSSYLQPGLRWSAYEGNWWQVPDYNQLKPVREGVANNVDLSVRTRDQFVALSFAGWLEVPKDGEYSFSLGSSGGSQLSIGLPALAIIGSSNRPASRTIALGQLLPETPEGFWAELEGEIEFISEPIPGKTEMIIRSSTGKVRARIGHSPVNHAGLSAGFSVRLKGVCWSVSTLDRQRIPGTIWIPDIDHVTVLETTSGLTRAEESAAVDRISEIKLLKREDAIQGHPVRIRGVVTWSARSAVVLQDSTSGIFVDEVDVSDNCHLRLGELWEVEGTTHAQFSPIVRARRIARLGRGMMPEPVQPAWDQLMNGSLDAQFVELKGIITSAVSNRVTLLTRDGKLDVSLGETSAEEAERYAGALVRIRGCLWAVKDEVTHFFKVGAVQMRSACIQVDEPAPEDPFQVTAKRTAELLLFDAQAASLKQMKVIGQVVHTRDGEHFLMDGSNGLRVVLRSPVELAPGDLVEVVGYPKLGGPSPILREALAKQIGRSSLPEPRELPEGTWPLAQLDGTRVRTKAVLLTSGKDRQEQTLSLQSGPYVFAARLPIREAVSVPAGSLIEVIGTFAMSRGDRAAGAVNDSFELLLNSAVDLHLVARPPWSTFRRMMLIVAILLGILVLAMIWISLLRKQVEQRSAQLRREIQERERNEQLRALESERARIARDLHDDLGSSLTEISLLADAGPGQPPSMERAVARFRAIGGKARAVVKALDVIVWLVNPSKDALPFMAGYLGSYAEDYLSASGIGCRLKIPLDMPSVRLNSDVRHNLFLAIKETLHNVVRHAHASEVLVEFAIRDGLLDMCVTDNGQGFDPSAPGEGNGLANLRHRLAGVGGRCDIQARPGSGASIRLLLPLPANSRN